MVRSEVLKLPAAHAARGAASKPLRSRLMLMLRYAYFSWTLDALLLFLFWRDGAIPAEPVVVTVLGSTAICLTFYCIFQTRWNERFQDMVLTVPQIAAATTLELLIALRTPQIGVLCLFAIFISFTFGALRLRQGQLLWIWLLTTFGITTVSLASDGGLSMPHATTTQSALSAIWIALSLGRCAFLGLYGASMRQQLGSKNRQLSEARDTLQVLATRDSLTGALNRSAIGDALSQGLKVGTPLAVILADLDHFKQVNDTYGHAAGDEVLRTFVGLCNGALRGSDFLGRYGGEEFLLVLPHVHDAQAAQVVANRVRDSVAAQSWPEVGDALRVTVSMGIAVARPGESGEALIQRADAALYRAKGAGRNQSIVAEGSTLRPEGR